MLLCLKHNGLAYKRTPKRFRYKLFDLLITKFKRTKTEQTKSTETTNVATDYSVPLDTLVSCDSDCCSYIHKVNMDLLSKEDKLKYINEKRINLLQQNLIHLFWHGVRLPYYEILQTQYQNEYQLYDK